MKQKLFLIWPLIEKNLPTTGIEEILLPFLRSWYDTYLKLLFPSCWWKELEIFFNLWQSRFDGHCCSVAKFCLTLCDPMDCRMPGFPVLRYFPEFAQTHVHWVGDATQPSHPVSPPSPSFLNLFQHPSFFQWIGSSQQVAKYWSFSFSISPSSDYSRLISFRIDWLDLLAIKGLSRYFEIK